MKAKQRLGLLIVDDETFNRTALKIVLKYNCKLSRNTVIHEASNGQEAIEMIKKDV